MFLRTIVIPIASHNLRWHSLRTFPWAFQHMTTISLSSSARRSSLDLARFIAAFGVVVSHVQASHHDWLGHLSVGLFLILTAVLAAQSFLKSGHYSMRSLWGRLMVPWLFWCAFYWLVELDVSDRTQIFVWPAEPWTVFAGPSIHLWFLPFVAVAGVCIAPLGRLVTTDRHLIFALAGFAAIAVPGLWLHQNAGFVQPVEQWFFAIPLYLIGVLFGLALPLKRQIWVVVTLAAVTMVVALITTPEPWLWQGLASMFVFWGLWNLVIPGPIPVLLGREAFGIYLLHPFFLLVIYKFLGPDLGWLMNSALAFTMSWAAAMIMRKIRYLDRLI